MQITVSNWLGQEFLEISGEAPVMATAVGEAETLFNKFDDCLREHGMDLSDTVRSRIFGRDRGARDAASDVRKDVLSGPARAATSSYIAPKRFASAAKVAMDLIALRPAPGLGKVVCENVPPRLPCRYITCGPLVIFSGQTAVLPTLEDQVKTNILPRITQYLAEAGSGWERVVQTSCYLHASQSADHLRALFSDMIPALPPRFDIRFVEGYSAKGKLVEAEVTALRDT